VYRPGRGCTILPPGAGPELVRAIPNPEIDRPTLATASNLWPESIVQTSNDALTAVVKAAFDGRTYGEGTKTIGVAVVQRGRIVAERYRSDFGPHTPYRAWSAAKMLTNALVGILVGRGLLDPDSPAPIPEWSAEGDPRASITVADLLHMSSGLEQKGAGCYPVYQDGADAVLVGGDRGRAVTAMADAFAHFVRTRGDIGGMIGARRRVREVNSRTRQDLASIQNHAQTLQGRVRRIQVASQYR
jgi:CubicO group peptidase (beta-lactamase class C family)